MIAQLENSDYSITLDRPIGSGGMGETYLHETNDGMLAKVMFDEFPETKIRYLISRPLVPSHNGHAFAWPIDIGTDVATKEAKLYVMPRAENSLDLTSLFAAADWLPEPFKYRVLLNKVRALRDLEQAGFQRGDMPNAMVRQDGFVTEIDLDSLQVSHPGTQFLCGVGKPDWLAPELIDPLMSGGLGEITTTAEHDAWSVAVSLWMLLRTDHPFDCRYVGPGKRPTRLERVERGHWPYATSQPDFQPRRGSPPLTDLDPELAFLFRQTFETGHRKQAARPNLSAWESALSRLDGDEEVRLSDEQWQCVVAGDRPRQRMHRKVPRAPFRIQALTAASLVVLGGTSFYFNQEPSVTNFAPEIPSATTVLTQPAARSGMAIYQKTNVPKISVPTVKLLPLVNPGHSATPALWSHLKENQK